MQTLPGIRQKRQVDKYVWEAMGIDIRREIAGMGLASRMGMDVGPLPRTPKERYEAARHIARTIQHDIENNPQDYWPN